MSKTKKITIDLAGPDGNAYVLMGYAKTWAKTLDLDGNAIVNEMMADDYEHLLSVITKNFGEMITLKNR